MEFKEQTGKDFLIADYQRFVSKAKQLEGAALTEESEAALAERSDILRFLLSESRALRQREPIQVQCPICEHEFNTSLGNMQGDTATPRCSNCGARFNIHRQSDGSVKYGSPPPETETVRPDCPGCGASIVLQIPVDREVNFFYQCKVCRTHIRCTGSAEALSVEDLGTHNITVKCPKCGNGNEMFIAPDKTVRFTRPCGSCNTTMQITGSLSAYSVSTVD